MPRYDDDALVLDAHPYRDRHQVLAVLTRHHGVIRGVLRGARGGKAPRAAATQLLSLVRITAFRGPNAELASISDIDLRRSSFPLAGSLASASAAAVVCELLLTYFPPEEPAEKAFRLGSAALQALLVNLEPDIVTSYVEYWVLILGGLLPPLDVCSRCGARLEPPKIAIDARGFEPLCASCSGSGTESLDAAAISFLSACRRLPVTEVPLPPPPARRWLDQLVRENAGRLLPGLDFFRRHGNDH